MIEGESGPRIKVCPFSSVFGCAYECGQQDLMWADEFGSAAFATVVEMNGCMDNGLCEIFGDVSR